MKKCVVCDNEVVWEDVVEAFEEIFNRIDSYGEYSLTENQQVVYHGGICSTECYGNM